MFIYGQYSPKSIVNTTCDSSGALEYVLVLHADIYFLYRIRYQSYNSAVNTPCTYVFAGLVSITAKTLDLIDKLRKAPIKEIPMELLEKIR